MKTFLRISKTAAISLLILASLGALFTLAFGLWSPIPGFTINFFDAEYSQAELFETGFIEWIALFFGTAIAYFFAAIVVIVMLAFAASVVTLTLLAVGVMLVATALAIVSPVLIVAGLIWLCVWGVRRNMRRNAVGNSGVVA